MLDAMLRKAGFLTFKQSLELEADNREMRQRIEYLIQRNRARSEALTRERDELKQRLEGIEKGWGNMAERNRELEAQLKGRLSAPDSAVLREAFYNLQALVQNTINKNRWEMTDDGLLGNLTAEQQKWMPFVNGVRMQLKRIEGVFNGQG
jgi:predicted nuclease with TOPRIM domain